MGVSSTSCLVRVWVLCLRWSMASGSESSGSESSRPAQPGENPAGRKEYQHLLDALSKQGEAGFGEYLSKAPMYKLSRGKKLNLELFQVGQSICVLKGSVQITVLTHLMDQAPKPVFVMNFLPGHVLAVKSIHQFQLSLVASSEEVILLPIPDEMVQSFPTLKESLDAVFAQVMGHLPRQQTAHLEEDEDGEMAGPVHASVKQCYRQLINYCPQLKEEMDIGILPDTFSALRSELQKTDAVVRTKQLAWPEILALDTEVFPLMVEDPLKMLHWCVGTRGEGLHELWFGRSIVFNPDPSNPNRKYNVMWLEIIEDAFRPTQTPEPLFSMIWYCQQLMKEWVLTIQMVFASVMVQVLSMGIPIFSMVIFDRVFGRQNFSTLNVMTIGVLIVVLTDIATKTARTFVLAHQMKQLDQMAMKAVLHKLRDAPIGLDRRREQTENENNDEKAKAQNQSRAQKLQNQLRLIPERFADLFKANQTIVSLFLIHLPDAIFSIALMAVLFLLSPVMAAVSLMPLIPIAIESLITNPRRKKAATENYKKQREHQLMLTEYLIHSETLQSVYAESFWEKHVLKRIQDSMRDGFSERLQRVGTGNIQGFFANLGAVLALFVGAHEVLEGDITFGVYLAVNMLGRQVVSGIQKVLGAVADFQEAREVTRDFQHLFKEEETVNKVFGQSFFMESVSGEIRMVNVHFRYDAHLPEVLKGLTLTIAPGQKVVLAGRSGSGKTTFLRLLQRFYNPTHGYICLDGINVLNMNLESLRQCVGVATQKPTLFSGTVFENLVMGNPLADLGDVIDMLQLVEMEEEIMNQPKGLETEVFPFGANFSGGQTARLALARLLLKNPSILCLDECLSQVDPSHQAKIYDNIWKKYSRQTCLLVTDYMPVHQRADLILVLHQGHIVEAGTYNELVQAGGLYARMYQPDVSHFQSEQAREASPV